MNMYRTPKWKMAPLVLMLSALQALPLGCTVAPLVPQLTQQTDNFTGRINLSTGKPIPFELAGTSPDIGEYTALGEVTFQDGETPGTLVGEGVAVFQTPDGSKLVAVVHWPVKAQDGDLRESDIEFRWRDSVQFSDGTTRQSDGKFEDPEDRPPGLVVIAIIAILIGLLVPAVQKCRGGNSCT